MKNYSRFKKEVLKDAGLKKAYDELGSEAVIVESIIKARIKKGMTQSQLAKKIGTKQSAISRLESGNYNPSIGFLGKVAKALTLKLVVKLT
jgi:ribosome-binding protein aMBF1 (putative translation factor)